MNEQLTSDELRQVLAEWIRPMYPKQRQKIAGLFEAVIARAEAAEARVADLEAALVGMDGHMARLISERNDALDRAEAAEALAYERLEAALFAEQRASDAEIERDSANVEAALEQSNAREAWIRVAELEAQLAAQGWRPGSEKPNMPEWYQVGDIDVGVYELWYSGEAWYRSPFQGATYRTPPLSAPDFWRPIPPLPAPDAQEPTP